MISRNFYVFPQETQQFGDFSAVNEPAHPYFPDLIDGYQDMSAIMVVNRLQGAEPNCFSGNSMLHHTSHTADAQARIYHLTSVSKCHF